MENKIDKTKYKLELVNQWITNCDSKSSFLLAFYSVIITIILTTKLVDKMILTLGMRPSESINISTIFNLIEVILLIIMVYFIVKCFYHIYFTLKARIDTKLYTQEGLITQSNIFFQTICQKSFTEFSEQNLNEEESVFLADLSSQVFINSNIANEKFKNYNKSIFNGFVSLIFIVLYLFI